MKLLYGKIEPMESLVSFIAGWLGKRKNAIVAGYYYSGHEQKNICIRINSDGFLKKEHLQEISIHKKLRRNTLRGFQMEQSGTFHPKFLDRFFEEQNDVASSEPIYIYSFMNRSDGKRDLLFIYYPAISNNQQIHNKGGQFQFEIPPDNDLNAEIEHIGSHIYEMQYSIQEQFGVLTNLVVQTEKEKQRVEEENKQLKELIHGQKIEIAKKELNKIAEQYNRKYILDDSYIKKLIECNLSGELFRSAVEKSYINSFSFAEKEEPIVLKAKYLYFKETPQKTNHNIEDNAKIRRVINYLDKLEQAALLAEKENRKLTSENIGVRCAKKLSPAAISDYNKRHKKWIQNIMISRTDEWPTLRKFKPIVNLLTGD